MDVISLTDRVLMVLNFRSRRAGGQLVGLVLLALLAGAWGYQARLSGGLTELQARGWHRLALSVSSLDHEIDKYAYFPATLGLEREVVDLLRQPEPGPWDVTEVNLYLEQLSKRAGALSVYLLDHNGQVVATSNWRKSDSFLGEDLSYRPYYSQAVAEGSGRFFGIGTTKGEPGYYLSSAIVDGDRLLGVAVVKVSLEQLERSWSPVEAPVLVLDENGVVILSSVAEWKFSTLRPLDEAALQDFDRTQHYNRRPLRPLPIGAVEVLDDHTRLMTLPPPQKATVGFAASGEFLAQSQAMPGTPWTITVFSHLAPVRGMAAAQGALAGVGAALVLVLGLMVKQRSGLIRERLRAREALQQAHDELERKVEERTADLSAANSRLQEEVAERTRAERVLRSAQDELVQAGKLAVIGQLSAGVAHELNQPLAALRTLSGNAEKFLERGDLATASGNLQRIGALVDSMGRITGQLKNFARKSTGQAGPVALRPALDNSLFLMDGRLRRAGVTVTLELPPGDLVAHCDLNRLEQVLVNLIGNAADAMEGQAETKLEIVAGKRDGWIWLTLRDHGPGLTSDALEHLFEPFFTTKDVNSGLGLGLPISAGIVRDFGGNLSGANHPGGGAVFTVELPASEDIPLI